jgi:hypothetical protein
VACYISIPEFSSLACEGLTGLTPCLLPEVTVGLAQYAIKRIFGTSPRWTTLFPFLHHLLIEIVHLETDADVRMIGFETRGGQIFPFAITSFSWKNGIGIESFCLERSAITLDCTNAWYHANVRHPLSPGPQREKEKCSMLQYPL